MKYQFCPKCGGGLKPHKEFHFECQTCGFIFYQNSKPTASAIITNNKNEVLLGRRSVDPAKGYWDIPGGFLELGEHPESGLRREIQEEVGVEIEILKFLGIFMDQYCRAGENTGDSTLNICYLAKITSGAPRPDDDVAELKWFSADKLPSQMAFKNCQAMLHAWKKILK